MGAEQSTAAPDEEPEVATTSVSQTSVPEAATAEKKAPGDTSPTSIVPVISSPSEPTPAGAPGSGKSFRSRIFAPFSSRARQLSWRPKGWSTDSTPTGTSRSSDTYRQRHSDPKAVAEGMDGLSLQVALCQTTQVKNLIAKGAGVNERDKDGDRYPLHWAAARDFLKCVVLLLDAGASKTAVDARGRTAAELAKEAGALRAHDYLMYGPAQPDTKTIIEGMKDSASLHCALNQTKQLEAVLKQLDVNKQDADGDRYPLHWAAARGHHRCVLLCLRAGADLKAKNAKGETAADLALSVNQRGIYNLLKNEVEGRSALSA